MVRQPAALDRARVQPTGRMLLPLLCGQALATMDSSIVNVAVPSIRVELPASGAQIQLVSAAYLITFAALLVVGARLGDRYGHGRSFRWGLAGFTAASLGCGLAPNAVVLVLARTLQGVAGALLVPQVLSLIQLRVPSDQRARAISSYSMVLAFAVALGQILGGVVVTADVFGLGWRPALLINGPVGVALIILARRWLPPDDAPAVNRIDLTGVVLLTASMFLVVTPLVFGREQGWPAWCLAGLAAGVTGLAVFVGYEHRLIRRGVEPLLDLRSVRPPGVPAGLVACWLVMGAYSAFLFTLTLHLQGGLGFTPLQAGLTFVPFAAGFALVSLTWTRLPTVAHKVIPVAGALTFAIGVAGVVGTSARGWSAPSATSLLLLAGAGHAAAFSPLFARLVSLVGPRHASALSALGNTGSLLLSALCIAGLAGLYLAIAEHAPEMSQLGLERVAFAIGVVLVVTAACAAWVASRREEATGELETPA